MWWPSWRPITAVASTPTASRCTAAPVAVASSRSTAPLATNSATRWATTMVSVTMSAASWDPYTAARRRSIRAGAGMGIAIASFPTSAPAAAARVPVSTASARRLSRATRSVLMPWRVARPFPASTASPSIPRTRPPSSSASSRARRCSMPLPRPGLASGMPPPPPCCPTSTGWSSWSRSARPSTI
ncbi:hypothetical protein D3C72_1705320 [compost metagenome]